MARQAGVLLMGRFNRDFTVRLKGEKDLVTEMDQTVQDLIEDRIRGLYPGHGILAEEGLDEAGSSDHLWIVDPLDGTTNYAHGFPVFSVSIGVLDQGEPLCGVVYNPFAGECFTALRGEGSFLNGFPIRVSSTPDLEHSLLATGFPYNIRHTADTNLDYFGRFALLCQGIRRCGSAALDLCSVACGRIDGFWEMGLKSWDITAGVLMVTEAGGQVTDFDGKPIFTDGSRTLASNRLLHEEMIQVLDR